ncbi:MAG TPA: orotate phosphoribosyltransferase [Armatimonadota bacterium]|jgi:orotate phosphoribosyltransferase
MSNERERLQQLIRDRALRFGDFTLASGQKSTYFIDGKQVTLLGEGLYLLAGMILEALDPQVQAVGGMSIGADPIAGAVIALAAAQGRELTGYLVRKERKDHGTGRQVEGPLWEGVRVAMLEDTITTGGSTLQAIDAVEREYQAQVVQVVTMVDRLQGAREALAARGYPLTALYEITEFGIERPA